jgi:hypothetical protein
MRTSASQPSDRHAWLAALVRELFQTEQSACDHPRVEVQRLGDCPPGECLRAVVEHAETALSELPGLVERQGLLVSGGGRAIGSAFSSIRDRVADRFLTAEKSYRGTLLGMRHGVDLVVLLERVARREGATELADWCLDWLAVRRGMIHEVEGALGWFAANPERAQAPAEPGPLTHALQSLLVGFEQITARWRRGQARPA